MIQEEPARNRYDEILHLKYQDTSKKLYYFFDNRGIILTALSSPFSIPIGGGWGDFPLNGVCRYG